MFGFRLLCARASSSLPLIVLYCAPQHCDGHTLREHESSLLHRHHLGMPCCRLVCGEPSEFAVMSHAHLLVQCRFWAASRRDPTLRRPTETAATPVAAPQP